MKTKLCGRPLSFGDIGQINALQEVNKLHDEMIRICREVCDINNYNDCSKTKKVGMLCGSYSKFLTEKRKLQ